MRGQSLGQEIVAFDPNHADNSYLEQVLQAVNEQQGMYLAATHNYPTAQNLLSPETAGFVAVLSPATVASHRLGASLLAMGALVDIAHTFGAPVAVISDYTLPRDMLIGRTDVIISATPEREGQIRWQIKGWLHTKVRHY